MKNYYLFLILALFIASCQPDEDPFSPGFADEIIAERDAVVDLVSGVVTKLTSSNPSTNIAELAALDELAGTRIIGMGEASHGTKEFFEMKHKILKYFVEEHGYRGIIMEADFGECLRANEYVLHDVGTIDDVMSDMHFWTWATEEVKEMIQWMHDYNLERPMEEKVYYLGSDCQYTDTNLELFEDEISKLPEEIENALKKYVDVLGRDIFELSESNVDVLDYNLEQTDSLIQEIKLYQTEIEAATSFNEYKVLLRLVEVCKQVYTGIKGRVEDDPYIYRDLYMAENTVWWADHYGEDEKFLVWAHNWHVSNYKYGDSYGGSQGTHLRLELGDDYKIIGFSMALGSINAVSNQSGLSAGSLPATLEFFSLNEIFYLEENDNFIWVFDDEVESNPDFEWFNESREFISVGSIHPTGNYYTFIELFKEYDTMIHFDFSTPTELIQ